MSGQEAVEPLVEDEPPRSLEVPGTAHLDSRQDRKEKWYLTGGLLVLTVVITGFVFVAAIWASADAWDRLTAQLGFLMTPFHTLLGIAVGYYFADKRRPSCTSRSRRPGGSWRPRSALPPGLFREVERRAHLVHLRRVDDACGCQARHGRCQSSRHWASS